MPKICGKIRNVTIALPEGFALFGQNVDDYPRHHFNYPVFSRPADKWGLQVRFAGEDEYIYGCWRERRNSDTFALEFVQEGEFEYIENGRRFECLPGDLFIVHPGSDTRMSALTEYGRKFTISMTGTSLLPLLNSLNLMQVSMFHVRKEEHIRGLFLELFTLLEKKPEGFPTEASILAYRILLELSSDHEYTEYPELLCRILNYMAERFNTPISISMLCREFKISSGTVYRLFRTYLKTSPIDYLIEERMKVARSLLLESHTPIKDIAFQVGYENQLYFSSEFRRVCGSSPRDFRKKGMQL